MSDPINLTWLKMLGDMCEFYSIDKSCNSTDPRKRYHAFAIAVIDGETNSADSFDTLEGAADWCSTCLNPDYPREPVLVVDLETGKRYIPRTVTTVYLDEQE